METFSIETENEATSLTDNNPVPTLTPVSRYQIPYSLPSAHSQMFLCYRFNPVSALIAHLSVPPCIIVTQHGRGK